MVAGGWYHQTRDTDEVGVFDSFQQYTILLAMLTSTFSRPGNSIELIDPVTLGNATILYVF
jgi:hypothetical protein